MTQAVVADFGKADALEHFAAGAETVFGRLLFELELGHVFLAHVEVEVAALLASQTLGAVPYLLGERFGGGTIGTPRLEAELVPEKPGCGGEHPGVVMDKERHHAALLAVLGDDADFPERPEAGEVAGQRGKADARHRHPRHVARETREDAAHLGVVETEQFRLGRGGGGARGQRVTAHLRFAGPLDADGVQFGLVLAAKGVQVVFRHPLHPVGQRVIEGLPGFLRGQGAAAGKHGVPPVGVAGAGLDGFGHLLNGLRNAVGVE